MSGKVKLEYYQTDTKVVISLFEKNVDESKLKVFCEPKRLKVIVDDRPILNTSLCEEVVHNEVAYVTRPQKIEITLKKKTSHQWRCLKDEAYEKEEARKKAGDKWEKMVKEVEEEEEQSQDVNGLFQKIFKDADDDTRRAMIKSYTESKGTVLSTNWKEIGNKKTDIKPPEGMEYKE
uniref:SGS domain-containing protein n=1 Tax=Panagrolaimus sp. JU765 TaxID=591449 RepID=A0AC34QUN5_9BILA